LEILKCSKLGIVKTEDLVEFSDSDITGLGLMDPHRKILLKLVNEAKKHQSSDDKSELESAAKALNDAIMPIGSKMYKQASEEAKKEESSSTSSESSDKSSDEPVEGEVVDDKKK
jgi:molecular chaperone DnaK